MTLPNAIRRNDYIGNGITTVFPYTFKIFRPEDLKVTQRNSSGVETTLVYQTDYTVSGAGSLTGGSVTLTTPLPSGYPLTIRRVRPLTQQTQLRNQRTFYPETHEDALDEARMVDQQQQDEIDRALRIPETFGSDNVRTVLPAPEAGKFLAWRQDGTGIENAEVRDGSEYIPEGTYAPFEAGTVNVQDQAERDSLFPPDRVAPNQKVFRVDLRATERWNVVDQVWEIEILTTRVSQDVGDTDLAVDLNSEYRSFLFATRPTEDRHILLPARAPNGTVLEFILSAPGDFEYQVWHGGSVIRSIDTPSVVSFVFSPYDSTWHPRNETDLKPVAIVPPNDFRSGWGESLGLQYFNGELTTSFDAADFAPDGPTHKWVDNVDGDNSADGSEGTPWRTLTKAASVEGWDVLHVKAGTYLRSEAGAGGGPNENQLTLTALDRSCSIIAEGGPVYICSHQSLSWSKVGSTDSHIATRSGVVGLWDSSLLDAKGDYTPLQAVANATLVANIPGSYYTDGTNVWVHTFDSRTPDSDVRAYLGVQIADFATTATSGPITVYLEGINLEGRHLRATSYDSHNKLTIYCKDFSVKYTNSAGSPTMNGVTLVGTDSYLQNAVIREIGADGINYHSQPRASGPSICRGVEINCDVSYTGMPGTTNDQPTTAHDGAQVVRISGRYTHGNGAGICDVNPDTQSWNVGCFSGYNRLTQPTPVNANYYIEDGEMWDDLCESGPGSHYDLSVRTNLGTSAKMFLRRYRGARHVFLGPNSSVQEY